MTPDGKSIVRRYYGELWNEWNFALVDELLAPDIRFRGSLGVEVRGRAAFVDYMQTVRSAFPDFSNHIEQLLCEGDTVVARLSYTATHEGFLFGVAPTGRSVRYDGVAIFRVSDGVIVEGWVLGDTLSLRRQIGAALEP